MESDHRPPLNYVEVTEQKRLNAAREQGVPWKKWGPYLSERQWGTVREDYSKDGNAWDYFTHDQSRSRAYRWGEDGIAGISEPIQKLSRTSEQLVCECDVDHGFGRSVA
jgi:hypothetical protein